MPAIVAGIKPPVINDSGYVTMGGPDEATDYVLEFGKAWKDTPGAIAWLLDTAGSAMPKHTRAKKHTTKPQRAVLSKR